MQNIENRHHQTPTSNSWLHWDAFFCRIHFKVRSHQNLLNVGFGKLALNICFSFQNMLSVTSNLYFLSHNRKLEC